MENCPNAPHGHFWALLDFRVSAGDSVLRDHLAKAPANAKYTSPSIQNKVADILGTQIKRNILDRVRRAKLFSVVADEATDSSNKQQLALALRYVDPGNLQIREYLVEFIECDNGVTGRAIAERITGFIQSSGLDPTKLRGQAYDGAGNMAGKRNGAAAIITRDYPLASYLHCASHSLNLAVVKSLEVQSVRNMIGIITRVSLFFHAQPQTTLQTRRSSRQYCPPHHPSSNSKTSAVRGGARGSTLYSDSRTCSPQWFPALSPSQLRGLVAGLLTQLTDASTLLTAITTTDFVSALVITSNSLNCLIPLTKILQSESKDIVEAVQEIDSLERILTEKWENVHSIHSEWFEEIDKMCRSMGVEPSLPRLCGRQQNRDNIPAQTPSQYHRRTVTIPVLDHLISEMNRRFSEHQKTAFLGLNLILSILVKKPLCEVESVLLPLESTYTSDLQDDSFKPELHQWYLKWKKEEDTRVIQALPNTLASPYFIVLAILLTSRSCYAFSIHTSSHLLHI